MKILSTKVLVTGSKGQLGLDMTGMLKADGLDVKSYDLPELDITNAAKVAEVVSGYRPDIIINCAAYTQVDKAESDEKRAYAVNRDGAANLAAAAEGINAILLHISTDFVFDGRKASPYNETDEPNPLSVYGASKLAGEQAIMDRHDKHIIIRTSWLYSTRGQNFVKTMLKLAFERDTLRVVYDQVGSPTWSADLAQAILKMIKGMMGASSPYGIFHYANEGVASWYDFAVAIVEAARKNGIKLKCRNVEAILTGEYPLPAKRPSYSVLDKSKIKSSYGLVIPHWGLSLNIMLDEIFGGLRG
ncbi:MAG: dTDP-4-dehydrorhamnose reductase [Deltaproteobacteria bacterium]|nr:dTDP-4-dehydrorhamnose reductase [Deltaproteobacteria bacterium]